MVDDDDVVIRYGVRELFERIDERIVRVDEKLSDKASTADVVALGVRVDRLEATKDRAWGVLIGLSVGAGGVAGAVAGAVSKALGG